MQKKASLSMAYLPEQLEMMLAEEKSKVSELERQLAIVTDLEQKYTGYWHDSETLRVAAENRLQQVQFAYYNLVSIHAKVNERVAELEEALGYYASPDVYEPRITLGGTRQPGVLTEGGDFARAALRSRQDPYVSKEITGVKHPNPISQILDSAVDKDQELGTGINIVPAEATGQPCGHIDRKDTTCRSCDSVASLTAQVRCVGCSGILIQQNLCHDCAETTQERYVCAYHPIVTRPAGMPCPACEEEKAASNDYDPTPWCGACGSKTRSGCKCGPIADNE